MGLNDITLVLRSTSLLGGGQLEEFTMRVEIPADVCIYDGVVKNSRQSEVDIY